MFDASWCQLIFKNYLAAGSDRVKKYFDPLKIIYKMEIICFAAVPMWMASGNRNHFFYLCILVF